MLQCGNFGLRPQPDIRRVAILQRSEPLTHMRPPRVKGYFGVSANETVRR